MISDRELRNKVAADPFHTGLGTHGQLRWDPRREGGGVCGMSHAEIAAAVKRVNETIVRKDTR